MGLGGIGRSLVRQAVEHGNNVVVIDQDESRCSEILKHYDILAITGNATDKSKLEEAAGIEGPMRLWPQQAMTRSTL